MSPLLLFPDFAIITIGYLLRRFWLPAQSWAVIEKLVYFVLFPCLLFHSIASSQINLAHTGFFGLGAVAVIGGSALIGLLGRPLTRMNRIDFASGLQTAYRFNSYIALALAHRVGGSQGVASLAILLAIGVPLCNFLAVGSMSKGRTHQIVLEICKNPLIIGTVSGIVFKLLHLSAPEAFMTTVQRLGQGAVSLGLLTVGAGLLFAGLKNHWLIASWWVAVKLLVAPLLAMTYARVTHLSHLDTQLLLMFAALPSASSAYILAARMGGNGPLVACLISMTTVGAAFSIPFVFWVATKL